jgi:enoyl-[acyl-carrier protein] reductase I
MTEASTVGGLLAGKRGLIVGVANQNSIAWGCASALAEAGMELAFTYQGETMKDRVARTTAELGDVPLFDLDVREDAQIEAVFSALGERWDALDFLAHSVAFAPREALSNPFLETTREAFLMAHDVSAYSLVALTRAAAPLMTRGGSIVTMTYYGSEKVIPGYNVMGVAKASLEASVRYLADNLGEKGIRVNAVSAGALNTLAARGVSNLRELIRMGADRSPMRRPVEGSEVGNATLFLASELSSGITGETIYVDVGYHIMGA